MSLASAFRHAYHEVVRHYDDRLWWKDRITQRVVRPIHAIYPGADGVDVMGAEWDTLLVLDACRADLFEAVADLGTFDAYRRVTSRASMTAEWVEKNFLDRRFGDTVYVSANPYVSKLAGESFHALVAVWETGFDETVGTVRPETVVDAARTAHERYPDKRLVVHFMQPHYPFVGHDDLRFASWNPEEILDASYGDDRPRDPWQALDMGLVSRERVWDAYSANLQYVLEHALALVADLPGRVVLTSDHGNLVGERYWPVPMRLYGHPPGVRHPNLVRIPWAIVEDGRRTIVEDGVTTATPADEATVERRLEALGYQ